MMSFLSDNTLAFGVIAIFVYLCATLQQGLILKNRLTPNRRHFLGLVIAALFFHALSTFPIIFESDGANFSFYRIAALISWFIVFLIAISSFTKPVEILALIIYPLAIITLTSSILLKDKIAPIQDLSSEMVLHILLSILSFSILAIAAAQGVFLFIQERLLKQKAGIVAHLPPLQTMESLMFQMIALGVGLLSLSIITGAIFIDDLFAQHLIHKTVLTSVAWFIFSILLFGRYQYGWRGKVAIRLTLSGFAFLLLAYFGSKLVLELILQRV